MAVMEKDSADTKVVTNIFCLRQHVANINVVQDMKIRVLPEQQVSIPQQYVSFAKSDIRGHLNA